MVTTRSGSRVRRQRQATPRRRAPTCAEAGAKLRTCPRPGVRARRAAGGAAGATTPSGSTTPPGIFGAGRPHIGKKIMDTKKRMEVGSGTHAGGQQTPPAPMGGRADHDMVNVPLLGWSENQKQRLRNGKGVRVKMGTGCDKCTSCIMTQENAKKIMKKKGGAATIVLGKGEIDENNISGSGIMPSKRGGPIHGAYKAPSGGAVGGLVQGPDKDGCYTSYTENYKTGTMDKKKSCPIKPSGKKPPKKSWKDGGWNTVEPLQRKLGKASSGKGSNVVRDPAKKVPKGGKTMGAKWGKPSGDRLKHNITGKGITQAKFDQAIKQLMKEHKEDVDDIGQDMDDVIETIIDEGEDMSSMTAKEMQKVADVLNRDYGIPKNMSRKVLNLVKARKETRPGELLIANKAAGNGIYASGDGIYARGNGMYARGGAIGQRMGYSEMSSIGAGGNLLGPMAASKAPQAAAQNWFFATQFQPAMAADIRG